MTTKKKQPKKTSAKKSKGAKVIPIESRMQRADEVRTRAKKTPPPREAKQDSMPPAPLVDDMPEEGAPAAVWVSTSKLMQWIDNPRDNDPAVPVVMQSIRENGFGAPLLARRANGEIIGGHTRIKAAMQLGLARVPVRYMDLTEEQAHKLAIIDNKSNELASWNEKALLKVLADMNATTLEDLTSLAFAEKEAKKMIALLAAPPEQHETDEDAVPEPPKTPTTKRGDLWKLGPHRLLCGDCRVDDDVARLFGETKAQIAMTSPPYASQRKYDESSGFKPIHPDAFVEWFFAVQSNVAAHLARDGSWFVNIKEHCDDGQRSLYVKDLTIAHVREWHWLFVDEFCWRNTKNGTPGAWGNRFKNAFEPVFHFAKQGTIKFRPDNVSKPSDAVFDTTDGKSSTGSGLLGARDEYVAGLARPSNVVECAASSDRLHSAAFPVALPEFFVRAFTDEGDVVFDPFMGSGTTMIACEKTKRIGYGTELSPAFCDVIVERWEKYTGQKAERIEAHEAAS